MWRGSLILGFVLFMAWPLARAAEGQQVAFASLDGTPLKAWVLQPAGKPKGTVVALHGCGGLYAAVGSRKGQLNARHQAMADLLLAQGYAVVFPDSLGPRGLVSLCTQKISDRSINQTQRRSDALASVNWIAAQPWAKGSKIALLGWSHGGSAVLAATDLPQPEVAAQTVNPSVAIAFYPGCASALANGYQPSTRLVLLLGALDDWTPPGPCLQLASTVGAEVRVYADSYHDFDNPLGTVKLRSDVPNGVNPGQGVHAGRNAAAREQSYARVLEVLRTAFD